VRLGARPRLKRHSDSESLQFQGSPVPPVTEAAIYYLTPMVVRRALTFASSLISLNSHRRRHAWYGLGLILRGIEMRWLEV
jgi:hypothetical protein